MADFDMAVTAANPLSVAGQYDGPASFSACACQGAVVGDVGTVTATYPAKSLAANARVRGQSTQASATFCTAKAYGTSDPPACGLSRAGMAAAAGGAAGGASGGSIGSGRGAAAGVASGAASGLAAQQREVPGAAGAGGAAGAAGGAVGGGAAGAGGSSSGAGAQAGSGGGATAAGPAGGTAAGGAAAQGGSAAGGKSTTLTMKTAPGRRRRSFLHRRRRIPSRCHRWWRSRSAIARGERKTNTGTLPGLLASALGYPSCP